MEEEKQEEKIEGQKKRSKVLIIVIICVVLAVVLFLVAGALRKGNPNERPNPNEKPNANTNTNTDNNQVSSKNKTLVEEMFTYGMETLYGYSKVRVDTNDDTFFDNYISVKDSDKCSPIGCMKILNWEEISSKFTDNFIKDLSNTSSGCLIVIIDDVAYIKDGLNGFTLEKINDVKILSETEDTISAKVTAYLTNGNAGIVIDDNGNESSVKETMIFNLSLVKEGSAWKIDSFKIE